MKSPDILDFAKLLEPIPGDNPAGSDVRTDFSPTSVYQQVNEAQKLARRVEKQFLEAYGDKDFQPSAPPDWKPVLKLGQQLLIEKTKDLEITSWMIEALARLHGMAGLRDGFRLARELVEKFWDHIYPRPDEDGLATTVGKIAGLNGLDAEGTLIRPIALLPITKPGGARAMNSTDFMTVAKLDGMDDAKQRAKTEEETGLSRKIYDAAVAESGADFYRTMLADLDAALEEYQKLGEFLDERCGADSPPTSKVREALNNVRDIVAPIVAKYAPVEAPAEDGQPAAEGDAALVPQNGIPAAAVAAGAVRNREDAFRLLLKVADFFEQTEPHSPVSFALKQAVRWGEMNLPELLTELLPDKGPRENLFRLLGIPQQEES